MIDMKTIVVFGSRSINDPEFVFKVLDDFRAKNGDFYMIHGGAIGVDRTAATWARQRGIRAQIYDPPYNTMGRRAPLFRNSIMADEADAGIAFWDGKSTGTAHMLSQMKKRNRKVLLIQYEQ